MPNRVKIIIIAANIKTAYEGCTLYLLHNFFKGVKSYISSLIFCVNKSIIDFIWLSDDIFLNILIINLIFKL